jgi:hypothetical protein
MLKYNITTTTTTTTTAYNTVELEGMKKLATLCHFRLFSKCSVKVRKFDTKIKITDLITLMLRF